MNMVVEMIMATTNNNNNNNNNNNKGQDVKVEMEEAAASRRWWFHSHRNSKRSPWLQSTLAELDKKTEAMLKLVETDADSFAQRAEMYYRKRLELIAMVEDFYRAYRSLAERYDQLKADSGNRLLSTLCSPFSAKYCPESVSTMDRTYDSPSETYDTEDSAESEVDDPDPEDEMEFHKERGETEDSEENVEVPFSKEERGTHVSDAVSNYELMMLREDIERLKEENRVQKEQLLRKDEEIRLNEEKRGAEVSDAASNAELMKLREEVERLREENRAQKVDLMKKGEEIQLNEEKQCVVVLNSASNAELMKLREELEKLKEENSSQREQLVEKDEDKREVIRQLSLGMEVLKSENVNLRKFVAKHSPKKRNHFEFDKLKEVFMGKFFNGSAKFQAAVIAI